ncbi:MAG: preprotein translocase subunit SecA [Ruminococcaceae bacterium]|nr:preprotein translocase subunit SecA [Oscillospiraceae bacterium]
MGLITKLFGTYSEREIKRIIGTVDEIETLADKYKEMPEEELRAITPVLKARLENGETLDDILPDAFAAAREAADRVLGKRPFRVQLIGGIILHQGRIAEMKTGEGKTLVATLPAYLNALTGKGVHIVTVNEYLASTGADEMGRVYAFLGLTTGLIRHGQSRKEKQEAYNCDITYGTNNEFGFDYLRDNMVVYKDDLVQRERAFAIVDEVDSILIDEARTPLIISGMSEKSSEIYEVVEAFVSKLRMFKMKEIDSKQSTDELDVDPQADYIVDEKAGSVMLTAKGIKRAEAHFGLANYSDAENTNLANHINKALKAHGVMKNGDNYIVKDDKVMIVDSFTGRIMPGRRYSDGLHQAIEAKEHVKIEKENRTLASITFQNYFRMYRKLSGMTGTALTEDEEFREIYGLDVVEIPTNKPMIRFDHNDVVYKSVRGKFRAVIEQIKECNAKGQPVLVGTVSVEKSEILSELLKREGIKHTVLNARHHEKEAEIVAMAGKLGKVTISTNMAGRGTDIMLGGNPEFLAKQEMQRMGYEDNIIGLAAGTSLKVEPEVLEAREVFHNLMDKYKEEIAPEAKQVCDAGGLFIIGTERHESRRIDNQLRGRSGRQGDPGESRFFVSLEDDLMRLFGGERIYRMMDTLGLDEDTPIDAKLLSNTLENAQKRHESANFERRKNVLVYDDIMNQQRTLIYDQRREVLDGANISEKIKEMITQFVESSVDFYCADDDSSKWNIDGLREDLKGFVITDEDEELSAEALGTLKRDALEEIIINKALEIYAKKDEIIGYDLMREFERRILLRSVDRQWMEHIDAMADLRDSIGLQSAAQRNPVIEYRIAGSEMFEAMIGTIREDTVKAVLSLRPNQDVERKKVAVVTGEGFAGGEGEKKQKPKNAPVRKVKVNPNDPCPCGSGKKYKKCCGLNDD